VIGAEDANRLRNRFRQQLLRLLGIPLEQPMPGKLLDTIKALELIGPGSLATAQCLTKKPLRLRVVTAITRRTRQVQKRLNGRAGVEPQDSLTDGENLAPDALGLLPPPCLKQDNLDAFPGRQRVEIFGAQKLLPALPGLPVPRFGCFIFSSVPETRLAFVLHPGWPNLSVPTRCGASRMPAADSVWPRRASPIWSRCSQS